MKKNKPRQKAGAFSSGVAVPLGIGGVLGGGHMELTPDGYSQDTFLSDSSLSGREIPPHLLEEVDVTTAALMLRVWSFFT